MAFDMNTCAGFGTGTKGNLTAGVEQTINSYASITNINGKNITLGNISNADDFVVGAEVLFHCSAYSGTAATWPNRGNWLVATIKSISGDTVTLSKSVGGSFSDTYLCQLVSLPHYKNITLNEGKSLTCPQFDASKGYGGIIAFKCSGELKFNGGHIDTTNKGLSQASLFQKGLVPDELNDAVLRKTAGWENHRAVEHLTINYPNGAVFALAKKITCHSSSRIGDPKMTGLARTASYSIGARRYDSLGGASILLCAQTIDGFDCAMIAKHAANAEGGNCGWGRCYIASETVLPTDEGLYAYDKISDPSRLSRVFNIQSFGSGQDGTVSNPTSMLNNYAAVTEIDSSRCVVTVADKTSDGLAKIKAGALCMIHCTQKDNNLACAGRFIVSEIVGVNLNKVTLADAVPADFWYSKYYIQLITIPQYSSFTLTKENSSTPAFDKGRGGILAIAVSETCDLRGGKLNVESKGGAPAYGAAGLNYIGNAQMADRLPIGAGNGSVFVLANNLIMNSATRLGATWSGDALGGYAQPPGHKGVASYMRNVIYQRFEGDDFDVTSSKGLKPDVPTGSLFEGTTGGGKQAGSASDHSPIYKSLAAASRSAGGYADNAPSGSRLGAQQGAHVLIVANKITGFNIAAISTGGKGGNLYENPWGGGQRLNGENGGASYGGGGASQIDATGQIRVGGNGGFIGGGGGTESSNFTSGGGSGAFAFIYCNN